MSASDAKSLQRPSWRLICRLANFAGRIIPVQLFLYSREEKETSRARFETIKMAGSSAEIKRDLAQRPEALGSFSSTVSSSITMYAPSTRKNVKNCRGWQRNRVDAASMGAILTESRMNASADECINGSQDPDGNKNWIEFGELWKVVNQ